MNVGDLLDNDSIGRMSDADFDTYWAALGTAIRLACRASTPEPEKPEHRGELSCTSASTQIAAPRRDWRRPAVTATTQFGFGR